MATQPAIEIEGVSIVLLGDFNPKIFQPAWFAAQELIRKEEAESAEIEVVHPEVVVFSLDWLRIQVTRNRWISEAQAPHYEPLRDLILGTFRLLRHTPIRKMGLNRDIHFKMPTEDDWNALGDRLAPKEPWKNILDKPGMRRLEMEEKRSDDFMGHIRIRIEPSVRIHPGVLVSVNDHYSLPEPEKEVEYVSGSEGIMNILAQVWGDSIESSKHRASMLVGLS